MKTIFDVNYQGHNIKVTNKWNDTSLVIDDVVVDSHKKIVALGLHLSGNIVGKNIKVDFTIGEEGYLLTANGETIAKKDVYGKVVELNNMNELEGFSQWSAGEVESVPRTNTLIRVKGTQWNSHIDGKDYHFRYKKEVGDHILTINGVEHMVSEGFKSQLTGLDEPIFFDGKEARLVKYRKIIDVAYGGVLLQSGEKYTSLPMWGWIPMVLCMLMPMAMGYPESIASSVSFIVIAGLVFIGSKLLKKKLPIWVMTILFFATYMRTVPLSAGIAVAGAYLSAKVAKSNLSYFPKVLLSILVPVAVWILPIIITVLIQMFILLT